MIKFSSKHTILAIVLSTLLLLTLCSCSNNEVEEIDNGSSNNNELYSKAMSILNEFEDDQRIQDFCKAHELLMSLPSNKDKFLSQLNEANAIYEKYGVEFKYGG